MRVYQTAVLPINEVGEGEARPPQLAVEVDAEVVQGYRGEQAGKESCEVVGAHALQAEGVEQLLVHRLDDLAH